MENNSLGKAIRDARGDLSLRDYAKKIGISHTHLDSIEKGYDPRTGKPVTISLDTFMKLSDGTGISLEKLIFLLKYNLNDLDNIAKKPVANRTPIENMVYNYFSENTTNIGDNIQKIVNKEKSTLDAGSKVISLVKRWTPFQAKKRLPILELLQDLSDNELLEVIDYIKYLQSKRDNTKGEK